MGKALRTLIVGLMFASILAACGGTGTAQTPTATTVAAVEPTQVTEPTEAATVATEEATAMVDETVTAATEETATAMTEETATAMTEETATATTEETATAMTDETATATTAGGMMLPEVDAGAVTGDIISAGSSTVYPLSERMAERFKDEGYAGNITIDSVGSGAGIERFCVAAETDIANSSRAIKDDEIKQCADKGREVVEFRVGTDAIAVVVSAENDFLTDLSLEQLAQIYSGEAKTWADVDASYPAEAIQLFSPGTDSGTFDYFVEIVLDKDEAKILGANPQLSENDNVLVQGVEGSPYAIGYFGYAYFNENKGKLKALTLDGVEPTEATAEDGSYALSRPLFIYSAKSILTEKPQVASFINFYLTNVNDEIGDVGYFSASEEALNEAKQNWTDAGN